MSPKKYISEELADWVDKHKVEVSRDAMVELYRLVQRRVEHVYGHASNLQRDVSAAAARLQRTAGGDETVRQRLHRLAGESWSLQQAAKALPPKFDWADDIETHVSSLAEDADTVLELCRLLPATALQGLFRTCRIHLDQEGEPGVEHPCEVADRLQRMLRTYIARVNAAAAERAADSAVSDDADDYGSLGRRDRGFGSGALAGTWLRAYFGENEDEDRDQLVREATETCVRALLRSLEASWMVLVPNDY